MLIDVRQAAQCGRILHMGYDQQVTVAFSHFAGYAHPGSAREITYQIRETLIVLGALASLACGQPLHLTYEYRADSQLRPQHHVTQGPRRLILPNPPTTERYFLRVRATREAPSVRWWGFSCAVH